MSDRKNEFGDELLVPARDELRSPVGKKRRGTSQPVAEERTRQGASGGVQFLLGLLVLGLFATGGAAYFFYTQGQAMLAELDNADKRIALMESRLSMTDEAAQESSLGFLEKVEFNFSEIDKLWAARNQNKTDIATNKTAMDASKTSVETDLADIERVISSQSTSMNENTNLLANIQTQIAALANNVSGMTNLNLPQQLRNINEDLNRLKEVMPAQGAGLTSRVDSNEQDIESINMNRLQVNQKLNALQNSINTLQQQITSQ